jgi:tetratricopeptide (TPR) repeat protein
MSNFSINPHTKEDIVDQYTDFLSNELNYDIWHVDENDVYNPLLLQQMGVLRASRIQKAVETNGEILYQGFNYTNQAIRTSSRELAKKMGQVAAGITSSLDRGFTAMHHSLSCINEGISVTNTHLGNINSSLDTLNKNVGETNQQLQNLSNAMLRGFSALYKEQQVTNRKLQNIDNTIRALGNMVGQGFSILHERLNAANSLLQSVLDELRIPETQRERRFHIEEGAKYLAMAMKENNQLYYEDAIAEFEAALKIERKDFYSWFSLGFIYLRSIYHINIEKSIDSFSRFVHYARADAMQRNNQSLKHKIDTLHLGLLGLLLILTIKTHVISKTKKIS